MALQVSPAVMTRVLMGQFGVNALELGVMVSFYFYSYTAMQLPVGVLFDRYDARPLFTAATAVCSCGALFFASTNTVGLAALGRLLMGFGSAFAFVGVLVVAARWFPPSHFAALVGVAQLLGALGALCGETLVALALESHSWRDVMGALSLVGAALTVACWVVVRDDPGEARAVPPASHLNSQLRSVVFDPQTWSIALYAFCAWGPMAVFASMWGVPFLARQHAIATAEAASAVSMAWLGVGLTSPVVGYVAHGRKARVAWLQACAGTGFAASVLLLYAAVPLAAVYPLAFLLGFAASGNILTFALVKENNKPTTAATAVGINNMAVVAGGAVLQPLAGFVVQCTWDGRTEDGLPLYSVSDYRWGLLIVPICFGVGIVVSTAFIRKTP
eukprot:gene20407-31408_t